MREIEVLAPAGSFEALKAAINGGCDAVYVGGTMFGARAYANNFNEEELIEAIRYVHLHGKQLFLTVNTILKNKELENELYQYLKKPYEAGLDAAIVQDVGVMRFIHTHFPDLPIHCSTQMTLTMANGADVLKEYGVTRLVTSRELSLPEIKRISESTDLEIESFVHGALCYSYSGQCLMSSMLGGRSGNRGRCAQTCRMQYELKENGKVISDKEAPYLLSPKDICTLEIVDELVDSGIYSFKIEGRMKRPEYTALVASTYRKYIDLYLSLGKEKYQDYIRKNKKTYDQDVANMMELYNRGNSSTGYYKSHNGKHMMSNTRPNHNGILVGEVDGIKGNKAFIQVKEELYPQDLLEIRGANGQVYEYTLKDGVKKGSMLASNFKAGMKFVKGDQVYRIKNQSLLDTIAEKFLKEDKKVGMSGIFTAFLDQPMSLTLQVRDHYVTVYGEAPQAAQKQAATEEKVGSQLRKTNTTSFEFNELTMHMEDGLFIPVGWINDLRRQAIEQLEQEIAASYVRNGAIEPTEEEKEAIMEAVSMSSEKKELGMTVLVSNSQQLKAALDLDGIDALYMRMDDITLAEGIQYAKQAQGKGTKFYLVMPHIFRSDVYDLFAKELKNIPVGDVASLTGFVIKNYEEYEFIQSHGLKDKDLIIDYNMYTVNQEAKAFWREKGITHYTASVELNYNELKELGCQDSDIVVYGHVPLMISAQCVVKNTIGCTKKESMYELEDRYHKNFIVRNYCKYCYNVIYNADPISLLGHSKDVKRLEPNNIRLEFTVEKPNEVKQIVTAFENQFIKGIDSEYKLPQFTKGHFKRGIE